MRRRLTALVALLALFGSGVSAYLTLASLRGLPLYCLGGQGCERVLASPYARLGPIPVAGLGLGMFLTVLVLTLSYLRWPQAFLLLLGIFTLSLSGVLYSAYLTYLSATAIGALCPWCLTSAATIAAILFLSTLLLVRSSLREGGVP